MQSCKCLRAEKAFFSHRCSNWNGDVVERLQYLSLCFFPNFDDVFGSVKVKYSEQKESNH